MLCFKKKIIFHQLDVMQEQAIYQYNQNIFLTKKRLMFIFLCIPLEMRQNNITSNAKFEAVSYTQMRRHFRLKFYMINSKSDETI